jgi:ribosome-binding protein aMBF1 (putative translation factor)
LLRNIIKLFPIDDGWVFTGKGEPWLENDLKKYVYTEEGAKIQKDVNPDIAGRVRAIRGDVGMSQTMFANEIGATRDVINSVEAVRQHIPVYLVENIFNRFGVSPLWLISGVGPRYYKGE